LLNINTRQNFPPAAHSRSSHRRTDFPTIQLILHPNSCIIYPGSATAGFTPVLHKQHGKRQLTVNTAKGLKLSSNISILLSGCD
jgi:hypothetical protein